MSEFRAAVHEIVNNGLKSLTHPVQGYIPAGGIDKNTSTCIIRVPNPHGGLQPGGGAASYIELKAVPLPFFYKGFIGGLLDLVSSGDRGVIVGFKGANMANPYIVSPLPALLHADKLDQTVDARSPVTASRATNVGGSHTIVTPNKVIQPVPQVQSFEEIQIGPPIPPAQFGPQDLPKLDQFNNLQSNLQSSIGSATSRVVTPALVKK